MNLNYIKKDRKSNFELFRIIFMIMIIGHHFAVHGFHNMNPDLYYNLPDRAKLFVEILMPGGAVGVAGFFMITGYFKINNDKITLKKVLLESIFYGVLVLVLFTIFYNVGIGFPKVASYLSFKEVLSQIFNPATSNAWWFLTSYIFLILLSPVINKIFNNLNIKGYLVLLIVMFLCIYSVDLITESKYFSITRGVFFYLCGGFIFKFINIKDHINMIRIISILTFIASWLIIANLYYRIYNIHPIFENENMSLLYFDSLNLLMDAILVPICIISLFIFFLTLNINNKIINMISKTTFGIYLLHDAYVIREIIWHKLINNDVVSNIYIHVYALIIIFSIFIICMLIDIIRLLFIEKWMVKFIDKLINKFKKECKENNEISTL